MSIEVAPLRQNVQVRFPDGRSFNGPTGTTVEEFIKVAQPKANAIIVAAVVNNKLRELSIKLTRDADIVPVTIANSDGMRIYRRSLCFLMVVAGHKLFTDSITIHHSMPFGGYYCERTNGSPFTTDDLTLLKEEMQRLVDADLPINQIQVPLEEGLALFRQSGDEEKAALFSRRRKDYLTLYELDNIQDYFHGFMIPSTGYLKHFDLHLYSNGFILHFPRKQKPNELLPFEDEPRLARIFQEYNQWLRIMGVPRVAALNEEIRNGRLRELILVAEAFHQQQLSNIANEIASQRPGVQIILISGPTSAGKTTFSKRLAIQLMAKGIFPITVGMDNYFVDRDLTPRDENGEFNFEALEAVDVPLFRQHLKSLLAHEQISQPRYNFHTGMREEGEPLQIGPEHVIIIEGIHGLNPNIIEGIPSNAVYRIFISAFTQLNLDKHNRVPTTDTRLLRRIVRDAAYRGYTASDTIRRWLSVRRGEKRYIFPNQNNANVFFNSALVYELSVLKRLAFPLLLQVEPGTLERVEANRLMAFLQWFDPTPPEGLAFIPNDSIVREFIGGSVLETFEPGTAV